jgi:hypothetical protein
MSNSTVVLTGERATRDFATLSVARATEFRARHGVNIMRGLTLRKLREGWGISARTWAEAAEQMAAIRAEVLSTESE